MIEAPPPLAHWHAVESVRFEGKKTFITLDCRHVREIVLSPEMNADPAKLIRSRSRFPCRVCASEGAPTEGSE
jgi:hypothetical protein